jgi:acyl-CoA thioesterase
MFCRPTRPICPANCKLPNTHRETQPMADQSARADVPHLPPTAQPTPQQTADLVRAGMLRNDRASRLLGMQIASVTPGYAVLTMAVRDEMLNGHDICHGGVIATLADSAFAFACNSHGELTVASGFAIDLLAPGRLGDVLTARCTEVSKTGRTGVYDVDVSNQRGERIAVFRGRSHTMKGKPAVPAPAPGAH